MKLAALIGALLSLATGGPPAGDREAPPSDPSGYAVDGGDFYVWDEEREEAEQWARELARSRAPSSRA